MSNNQNRPETNGQQNQNQKVSMQQQAFVDLYANNLGMLPSAVTFELNNHVVCNALTHLLQKFGVEDVNDKVFITATYNQHFNKILQGKGDPKEHIDPFNFHCVLRLDKSARRNKGGKKTFGARGDSEFSRMMNTLNSFSKNASDKAQFDILGDEKLNQVLSQLTDDNKLKWHYAKNKNAAVVKLSTNQVLRYLLDIPQNGGYVIDVLRARSHKDRGFSATILKSVAPKNFKRTNFDPLQFVR